MSPTRVSTRVHSKVSKKKDFLHARAVNQDSFNEITCPKRFLASKCDVGNWKIHIRDIFKILVNSIKGNSLTQKLQKVDVKNGIKLLSSAFKFSSEVG